MTSPRFLRQPGPVRPKRIDIFADDPVRLTFPLHAGATLAEAVTGPLLQAGLRSAAVRFERAKLAPFRYVIPAPSPDDAHVAWFSKTYAPDGVSTVELACATFGFSDGKPAIHCHAAWREPDGRRRGGHILPGETVVTEPAEAVAWGFRSIGIETLPDAETNFTLFQPTGPGGAGSAVVARVAPNEDILLAIEAIAQRRGIRNAVIHGTLGSLVGIQFRDGRTVTDHATEVLVKSGHVREGAAELELLAADMGGEVHEGRIERGQNPVCITFDVVLEETAASDWRDRRV